MILLTQEIKQTTTRPLLTLRVGVTIVGTLLIVISAMVLFNGDGKLAALNACSYLKVCSNGMDPSSQNFRLAVSAAQYEVAYGVIFGLIGVIVLIFGVFGGRRSKQKPNQNEYGRTFEDNAPSALYGSRMPQRNKLYLG